MSRWRSESVYLGRYAGSGAVNTIIGFAVIFLLMALGVSPIVSNVGGYLVGFFFGFVVSKRFVFRSGGRIAAEGIRYLAAFLISLISNLLVLHFTLEVLHLNASFAQLPAAVTYMIIMYLLTRWFVFYAGMNSQHHEK